LDTLHARAWAHAHGMRAIEERALERAFADLCHANQQAELRLRIAEHHEVDRQLAAQLETALRPAGQPEPVPVS